MNDELEKLETKLAFQEDEIQTLHSVILKQQTQIDKLADQISLLQDKMKDMQASTVVLQSEETPPPHY
ncbi:MAG: SlyX family protein [Gammaproteobacteria bacterium]|nr:SlyX family protein [Gammaproteobacteria bacterium]